MKNKYEKAIFYVAVLTFVFTAGLSGTQARAEAPNTRDLGTEIRAEYILESLEESDYEKWKKLVNPNSKLARKVSPEVFHEFTYIRQLARDGRYDESLARGEKLKDHLGLDETEIAKISVALN